MVGWGATRESDAVVGRRRRAFRKEICGVSGELLGAGTINEQMSDP